MLSAGQVLETIQSYNVLTGALLDLQVSGTAACLPMSINLGTGFQASSNYDKYGKSIAKSGTGEFSVPLACSGVLGSGCSKYLPIAKVNDLRLELTMENATQAVVQWQTQPRSALLTHSSYSRTSRSHLTWRTSWRWRQEGDF